VPLGTTALACYEAGMHAGEKDGEFAGLSARLLARQAELRALSDGARDSRKPVELDQSKVGRLSRMDAMQDQAMAQESERRRMGELQRIEAALERLTGGDYGYCVSCEEAIAPARLELDPAVATCIECAGRGRR
jgi:DnaK suppressor protein